MKVEKRNIEHRSGRKLDETYFKIHCLNYIQLISIYSLKTINKYANFDHLYLKFVDDSTKAASVNLKNSLVPDPKTRVFPLSYNERTQMVIKPEENMLQIELDRFHKEATQNNFVTN